MSVKDYSTKDLVKLCKSRTARLARLFELGAPHNVVEMELKLVKDVVDEWVQRDGFIHDTTLETGQKPH